jgi:digeranylgeranylglycerophospholipid reductase
MSSTDPRDGPNRILVAGAGPGGLSCAYWAAREGLEVVVYEKEKELADKPCGELIPEQTLDYTPFDAGASWILNRIERGNIYYKGEYMKELIAPSLIGYTIDKRGFLEELRDEAEAQGAEVRMGQKLGYDMATGMDYDLLVDATGYHRTLARSGGFNYRNQRLAPTLQAYCTGKVGDGATHLNLTDTGYSWAFPRGDLVNFGFGGFLPKKGLYAGFQENMDFFGLKLPKGQAPRVTLDLVGGPVKNVRRGNMAVVGEAAGAVMSTTGEGIRFALWSGTICYKENYDELFWGLYGDKLRMSGKLLKLALILNDDQRLKLLRGGSNSLHATLLDGERPSLKDLATVPWLMPYLAKLWVGFR